MPAIDNLLKRWGFVRLSRYGLVLTPEGRIMSLRPAVLDDGMRGRIVGWQDDDLAAMELEKWEPARPAPQRAVASRVASAPPPLAPLVRPVPSVAIPPVFVMSPPISIPDISALPSQVAPAAEVDEDEWEWTIALARARAAADEVEVARAAATTPTPPRRTRQDTVPPPPGFVSAPAAPKFVPAKTLPIAMVAISPIDSGEWPKTEPLGNIDYEDYTSPMTEVVRVAPTPVGPKTAPIRAVPAPRNEYPRAPSPVTVIPVPKLPRIDGSRLEPVVRALPHPLPPLAPRRFPKGTGPHDPRTVAAMAPPPPIRPAEDDRTSPGIAMPSPAVAAIALPKIPGIKRLATRG